MNSFAQDSVSVTFKINTAFVPDTITNKSTVQIRGGASPLSWDHSSVNAENIGGDYWKSTIKFPSNSNIPFLFFTNSKSEVTGSDGGWEYDLADGNRTISIGTKDTVLDVQYVNGWNSTKPDQYAKPFAYHEGKFVVWVRVNMQNWAGFDTSTMKVGIRGSTMSGGDPENLNWGATTFLTAEKHHPKESSRLYNGKYLWSGPVYINKSDAGKGLRFKFVLLDKNATPSTDWNDMIKNPDEQYEISTSGNDTTLTWKWFNHQWIPYNPFFEKIYIHFTTDLDKAILNNGFNPETDTLYVKAGLNSTANELVSVKLENTGGTIYEGDLNIVSLKGIKLQYAFFKAFKDPQTNARTETKEFYFDNFDTEVGSNQENRKIVLNSATVNNVDSLTDNVSSHRSPYFKNTKKMAQDTRIILEVDYRPALNEVKNNGASLVDGQNQNFVVDASNIDGFTIYVNGPITKILDGTDWAAWFPEGMTDTRKMYDDGTHGDLVAGDNIHTITFDWTKVTEGASVTQIFKFGINGGNNEAAYGNNHIYNVKDGLAEQRVRAVFGDIQPSRYPNWDFVNQTHATVNVTFRINTAFVPYLIKDTSTVQIRVESAFASTFTSIKAINDGGDYWKATVKFPSNTSVNYQFFTNSKKSVKDSDKGIEAEINSDKGKRKITVGLQDTVLDLQYVNGWNSNKPDQFAKPFIDHEGKFVVWVRVNMENWYSFDTTTMKVGIRGSTMTGGDPENLSWGSTTFLSAEKPHPNPESRLFNEKYLWSGPVYINKADAGKGLRFKFLLLAKNATSSTDWGDMIKNPDEQYEITTSGNDTTVAWKWFIRPFEPFYEKFKLHFITDLDKTITNNGFNPETDTLYVKTGLNSTAPDIVSARLVHNGGTIYEGDIILNFPHILKPVNAIGKINSDNKSKKKNNYLLQYAFFKVYKNSQNVKSEQKEFFYDYFDLETGSNQQNRKVELNADSISISDDLPDNVSSHRSPFFLNTNTIQQDTKIIVEVDYRPALNEVKKFNKILNDVQGTSFKINEENIDSFDVYINGPIAKIVDGKQWTIWNKDEMSESRKMFDDGTHDDLVAGDSILTSSFDWKTTDLGANVSMLFKFGINGYDNEASYGNHHFYNVKNGESIQRFRIQFGEQDPARYPHWDYMPLPPPFVHQISTKSTGFELMQNFPNPFNPTTNIQFSVPKAGLVKLEVIDLLGRTVISFSETISSPGVFQKTITGVNLTSGTYLIKMTAGSFTQTRKMIFMK